MRAGSDEFMSFYEFVNSKEIPFFTKTDIGVIKLECQDKKRYKIWDSKVSHSCVRQRMLMPAKQQQQ